MYPRPAGATSPSLFLENLPTIQKIAAHVARRYRLSSEDAEEFSAEVNLKLISDDYRALRNFEGRSKLESYLFMIIHRAFWEWRNKQRGRWRPSAEAQRLGEPAIKHEQLLYRDGYQASEAAQILSDQFGLDQTQIDDLYTRLPQRTRREMVSETHLEEVATAETNQHQHLLNRERENLGHRVQKTVDQLLNQLTEEDQLILKLNFRQNVKLVDIAQSLGYPPKKLYKRVKKLLSGLHQGLKRAGFGKQNREELFEATKLAALLSGGNSQAGPSNTSEGHCNDELS